MSNDQECQHNETLGVWLDFIRAVSMNVSPDLYESVLYV